MQGGAQVEVPDSKLPVNPPFNNIYDYVFGQIVVNATIKIAFEIDGDTPMAPVNLFASGNALNSEPRILNTDDSGSVGDLGIGWIGGGNVSLSVASDSNVYVQTGDLSSFSVTPLMLPTNIPLVLTENLSASAYVTSNPIATEAASRYLDPDPSALDPTFASIAGNLFLDIASGSDTVGHGQTVVLVPPGTSSGIETLTGVSASSGTAVLNNGKVGYTAPASGPDTLTYTVQDQYGHQAAGTVIITIDPGPTTVAGNDTVGHNQTVDLTGFIDALVTPGISGDTETLTAVSASSGTAVLNDGKVGYTAPASGSDALTYTVQDQYGDQATGKVTITVDRGPTAAVGNETVAYNRTADLTGFIDALVTPGISGDTETLTGASASSGTAVLNNGKVIYTAPSSGTDMLTYTVQDQYGDQASGLVNITVTGTVDPGPTAATGDITVGLSQTLDLTAFINALITPGISGDTETLVAVDATNGAAVLNNGEVSYTALISAPDTLSYTVQDQYGDQASGLVNITVTSTVDPGPTAATGNDTVGHNKTVDLTSLINALVTPGISGDTETLTGLSASSGTAALNNGKVTYTAPASGTDTLTYTVQDQYSDQATGKVNITVDLGPTAATGNDTVGHNKTVDLSGLINALVTPGISGDAETLTGVSASSGTAALNNGKVTYTAPASGTDTLTYTVQDQYGDQAAGKVNIAIDPGPTAATGNDTVGHNKTVDLTNLINALVTPGISGDTETLTGVSASSGTAALSNGKVTYTAPASGTDTLTYTVQDQYGDQAAGKVNIAIDPGPTAATGNDTVGHNQTVDLSGLINALVTPGISGDTETLTGVSPSSGTAALNNGKVTYTAPASGTDTLTYTVQDQYSDQATGKVNITVDLGPTAATGNDTVGHNKTVDVTGFINALVTPGISGDTETLTGVSASSGTAAVNNGKVTYTAPASGTDTLTYTIQDQYSDQATGKVNITVDPGPSAGTLATSVNLGQTVDLTSALLGVDKPGETGDMLSLIGDGTTGTLGTVALAAGKVSYAATGPGLQHIPANGSLADSFTYAVSDQYGDTATGTANITVKNPASVINGPASGNATIQGTSGADVINTNGSNNTVYDNGGNDQVNLGGGNTKVYTGGGDVVVNLNGSNNLVSGGDGWDTVTGGSGTNKVTLGNGNDTVNLGGSNNKISLGAGNDTIDAGSGSETVTLTGGASLTNDSLAFHGSGDVLNLQGSGNQLNAAITDQAKGLQINISNGGSDTISNFAADTTALVHLVAGFGGYTSASAVVSALHSDGHGGTLLPLGAAGSIDFIGVGVSQLHTSNFSVS
jgi:glutamate mutase epsilon subunit